ncbi:MAG: sugar ABC transporter permease [Anaerolineae bacterium]|nr:sugar ABC transporter permease [Anaerolineae bacterium]
MEATTARPAHVEQSEGSTREDRIMRRVFLSPAIIVLLLLSIFPMLWSLGISFTNIQRGATASQPAAEVAATDSGIALPGLGFEVTLRNFARMPQDQRLITAAANTLFYVFAGVIIQYVLGFGLALVLNQEFFARNVVRVIFLMPMMMTPVAAAYSGRMLFDSTLSPLAQLFRTISTILGLEKPLVVPWLTSGTVAPWTIVLIDSWQWTPFVTLILLSGLQAIPDEIYEAARVDGANALQILRKITFPLLLPLSATVILIRGLEIFKIIDVVVVATGGGPGSATESLTMYIFKTALTFGNFSYAAAISFVLLVLVIIFATVFLVIVRRLSPQAGS